MSAGNHPALTPTSAQPLVQQGQCPPWAHSPVGPGQAPAREGHFGSEGSLIWAGAALGNVDAIWECKGDSAAGSAPCMGGNSRSWYCPAPDHVTVCLPCSTLAFMPLQNTSRILVCFSLQVGFILAQLLTSFTVASALVFSESMTNPCITFPALWFDVSQVLRGFSSPPCVTWKPEGVCGALFGRP